MPAPVRLEPDPQPLSAPPAGPAPLRRLRQTVGSRLTGPGGLYNLGNTIVVFTGIGLQLAAARDSGGGLAGAVHGYFFGSPEATVMTFAIALFILAGELYHRAWRDPEHLDRRLIWRGDLVCGFAAAAFTVALVMIGETVLALLGGAMLTAGRFGLVMLPVRLLRGGWDRLLRRMVALSRAPSLLSVALALVALVRGGAPAIELVAPLVLFGCLLIWLRADLMFERLARAPG
jgi:hypothetical protein